VISAEGPAGGSHRLRWVEGEERMFEDEDPSEGMPLCGCYTRHRNLNHIPTDDLTGWYFARERLVKPNGSVYRFLHAA
jgi:hypothetical protein